MTKMLSAILFTFFDGFAYKFKEECKDQESIKSIQSSTTPDPGHNMGK